MAKRISYKGKSDEELQATADVASINRQLSMTQNGYTTTDSEYFRGVQRRAEAELRSRES